MKILAVVIVWAVVFAAGFVVPRLIEPTGDSFTRGMNRIPYALGLHCLGLMLAIAAAALAFLTRKDNSTWQVVVGFVPLTLDLLLILFVAVIIFGAMFLGL